MINARARKHGQGHKHALASTNMSANKQRAETYGYDTPVCDGSGRVLAGVGINPLVAYTHTTTSTTTTTTSQVMATRERI